MDSQLDQALATARAQGWTVVIRGLGNQVELELISGDRSKKKALEIEFLEEQSEPEDVLARTIQELIRDA